MQQSRFEFPSLPEIENESLKKEIRNHLDDLTKPKGSLGRLEECAARFMQCRGSSSANLERMSLITFAGDHGIAGQGITPFPQEVTAQMVLNMVKGGAAVSVMCVNAGIDYRVVDMGVASELPDHPLLIKRKIAAGTSDLSAGYAMTSEQCATALSIGIELAEKSEAPCKQIHRFFLREEDRVGLHA